MSESFITIIDCNSNKRRKNNQNKQSQQKQHIAGYRLGAVINITMKF